MHESFLTLAGEVEAEHRVLGSRFLAIAFPVRTEEAARARLEERARAHFSASHHCAAWRLRDGTWRALDAGEPSGSAGLPILAALDGLALLDAAVVVSRYFGGTKLGIGGLARAYGEAATLALEQAPRRRGVPALLVAVAYRFEETAGVMRALGRHSPHQVTHDFDGAGGRPTLSFVVPAREVEDLRGEIRDQTAGSAEVRIVAERILYLAAPS
jgi:putative IMPACT (imprinted ancient) family translation regulator